MHAPLPSLNALRAFEATARQRSISRAAAELGVTHGAVSRQIKVLEEVMGVSLLMRDTNFSASERGSNGRLPIAPAKQHQ
ncbi:LysR family transcriptional regulator [Bradyrhizobium sp. 141]|uniref:LysR family transcriptional regulator n=1 Tax=Bradyrhizobium sp. 141 TaxID=2782617 RepID=UPI003207AF9B|nr:LysR family transcriptional regulator [Bradyrhizobium sp. 141]